MEEEEEAPAVGTEAAAGPESKEPENVSHSIIVESDPSQSPGAGLPEVKELIIPPVHPLSIPSSAQTDQLGNTFSPENILSGPPVYVRKQVYYQGHASVTYSTAQAINIIDYIGKKYDSADCIPFAVKIIENGELISIAEDNGEFSCGVILANSLKKLDGYNVLVAVTRKVKGCFVTDMIQGQKRNFVKLAAEKAIDMLLQHVTNEVERAKAEAEAEARATQSKNNSPTVMRGRLRMPSNSSLHAGSPIASSSMKSPHATVSHTNSPSNKEGSSRKASINRQLSQLSRSSVSNKKSIAS